jgi:two-component system response regulator TctD
VAGPPRRQQAFTVRILLAEDAEDLGDAVAARLRASGHAVEWHRTGTDVAARAREEPFDALVLDVNLPGRDGFAVLAELRRAGVTTPVLVVTARAEVDDKVSLLDLGADDYIVKPFDLREFEARLRAVIRRPTAVRASLVRVGALGVDAASRTVVVGERPVDCGRREFRVLEVLVARLGQVVAKERLMSQVFGAEDDVGVNALELVVSRLRRKLDGAGVEIVTVRGSGYLMRAAAPDAEGRPDAAV